ncbi:cornifelin homolog B-like [Centroberyx affinis]|uniref:cornifelin homolog B-like n=1 Tax=Centroberyx affinis TaxID=166261 RepID=UPI003A5C6F81
MTSLVFSQPRSLVVSSETDDWASGVCDCCDDMADCCLGFWCCPCFACKTTKAYGQCLCLPLLDIFGCIPPVTMTMRVSMRQRYGIKGNMCQDCVCATCCSPCVWCQMSREMKTRKFPAVLGDIVHRR